MYWLRHTTGNWDPFAEFRALGREMNRAFDTCTTGSTAFPALNVWGNQDEAVVKLELPGVDPEKVSISVEQERLTIEGERAVEEVAEVVRERTERPAGRFTRSVTLPFEVEQDQVKADYRQGVLSVTLPRAEATKPRRIEITAG